MPSQPFRLVVLGGTGFIGSAITASALASGLAVTVVSRTTPGPLVAQRIEGADQVLGDISQRDVVESALRHADHVIYAVGNHLPADSNLDVRAHSAQALAPLIEVLEALRDHTAVGVTFLSSGGTVYGDTSLTTVPEETVCNPKCSYGVMELASEHYVGMYRRLHGIPSRVLRLSNPYGPLQRSDRGQGIVAGLFAAVTQGSTLPLFGQGNIVRDFIHVEDVASAVTQLLSIDGPSVLNIGSGVGHSIRDVIGLVEDVTGGTVNIEPAPARSFDVRKIVLNTTKLQRVLEWTPRSLRVGLTDTWKAMAPASVSPPLSVT